MNARRVALLPIARDDIEEIYLYVAADNPGAAVALTDKILARIDSLESLPLIGKIVPDAELAKRDYRMLVVDDYLVFYRVVDDIVVVYRVLHGARDYPYLLK